MYIIVYITIGIIHILLFIIYYKILHAFMDIYGHI